jgi:hypothetical protein
MTFSPNPAALGSENHARGRVCHEDSAERASGFFTSSNVETAGCRSLAILLDAAARTVATDLQALKQIAADTGALVAQTVSAPERLGITAARLALLQQPLTRQEAQQYVERLTTNIRRPNYAATKQQISAIRPPNDRACTLKQLSN